MCYYFLITSDCFSAAFINAVGIMSMNFSEAKAINVLYVSQLQSGKRCCILLCKTVLQEGSGAAVGMKGKKGVSKAGDKYQSCVATDISNL